MVLQDKFEVAFGVIELIGDFTQEFGARGFNNTFWLELLEVFQHFCSVFTHSSLEGAVLRLYFEQGFGAPDVEFFGEVSAAILLLKNLIEDDIGIEK